MSGAKLMRLRERTAQQMVVNVSYGDHCEDDHDNDDDDEEGGGETWEVCSSLQEHQQSIARDRAKERDRQAGVSQSFT